MSVPTTLRRLEATTAIDAAHGRAEYVDLRRVEDYLRAHIHASVSLVYEQGPGLAGRARDCLPLDLPLLLIDDGVGDVLHAAASLRGKGYEVLGLVARSGLTGERHAECHTVRGPDRPDGFVLDVGDPGTDLREPPSRHIPIDRLWDRAHELAGEPRVVIASGRGVRAALAVGILEGAGVGEIVMWRTIP